jgi:hypothetical protein
MNLSSFTMAVYSLWSSPRWTMIFSISSSDNDWCGFNVSKIFHNRKCCPKWCRVLCWYLYSSRYLSTILLSRSTSVDFTCTPPMCNSICLSDDPYNLDECIRRINADLNRLYIWVAKNGLYLNPEKSQAIVRRFSRCQWGVQQYLSVRGWRAWDWPLTVDLLGMSATGFISRWNAYGLLLPWLRLVSGYNWLGHLLCHCLSTVMWFFSNRL